MNLQLCLYSLIIFSLFASLASSTFASSDTINFYEHPPSDWGNPADQYGDVVISGNGASLTLNNNIAQKIDFPYTVTPNTVLELKFATDYLGQVESQGIGFCDGNAPNRCGDTIFVLHGTDTRMGIQDFNDYAYLSFGQLGGETLYQIPVGQYFTGSFQHLVFFHDDDANPSDNKQSRFFDVRIYEYNPHVVTGKTDNEIIHGWSEVNCPFNVCPRIVMSQMQTSDGPDTAAVRVRNLKSSTFEVKIQEEISLDPEIRHTTEEVGYLGFKEPNIISSENKIIGRVGQLGQSQIISDKWHTLSFGRTLQRPVVIMTVNSYHDSRPVTIRLRNVTRTSAEYRMEHWSYQGGTRRPELISYIVVEEGFHTLKDGKKMWVSTERIRGNWATTVLRAHREVGVNPVALSLAQSNDNPYPIVTRMRDITPKSYSVKLQHEESLLSIPVFTEKVGVVLVGSGYKTVASLDALVAGDDASIFYVNGIAIGSTMISRSSMVGDYRDLPLRSGKNTIGIKGFNFNGAAGLLAELMVNGRRIGTGADWKVSSRYMTDWNRNNCDEAGWVPATEYGQNGVAPWGTTVSEFPSDTPGNWVWSDDNNGDNSVYLCYVIEVDDDGSIR